MFRSANIKYCLLFFFLLSLVFSGVRRFAHCFTFVWCLSSLNVWCCAYDWVVLTILSVVHDTTRHTRLPVCSCPCLRVSDSFRCSPSPSPSIFIFIPIIVTFCYDFGLYRILLFFFVVVTFMHCSAHVHTVFIDKRSTYPNKRGSHASNTSNMVLDMPTI